VARKKKKKLKPAATGKATDPQVEEGKGRKPAPSSASFRPVSVRDKND
jgi:hypothetical protein